VLPSAIMRLFATTRGKIVALIRRGVGEVEEIARELDISPNAVRTHLAALERDGIVGRSGVRRTSNAGKPPTLYQILPDAEPLFSRAYAPVLGALLDELADQLSPERAEALMQAVGHRLAETVGQPPAGDLNARAGAAVALLNSLGGEVRAERTEGAIVIRGMTDCPMAAAVGRQPMLCRALESLLSEFIGVPVRECCDHGERPRCCFQVLTAA
jgi:predicted ArsR family transcriptional regulator